MVLASFVQDRLSLAKHQHAKNRTYQRVKMYVTPGLCQYTGLTLQHFGSFTSKLNSPESDIDLTIDGCLELNDFYNDDDG